MEAKHRVKLNTFILNKDKIERFWTVGDDHNPPLLLIPGYTGDHGDLLELSHLLTDNYHIIIPDLPGWNKTDRLSKKLTIHNYAIFLKDLLYSLNISNITIVGHCMGGTIALEITYLFPDLVDNLFVISVPYLTGTIEEKLYLHLANLSEHTPYPIRKLLFFWRARLFSIPLSFYFLQFNRLQTKVTFLRKTLLRRKVEKEDAVEETWNSLMRYDYNKVKKIAIPVHIIYGVKDYMVRENQIKKFSLLVPHYTLDPIQSAGHLAPLETPAILAHIILNYN